VCNFKMQLLHYMEKHLPSVQSGKVFDFLTKGEAHAISRAWDSQERNKGFHLFIKDPAVVKEVEENLAARAEKLSAKAKNQGVQVKPENPLNAYHAVRTGMWKELTAKERSDWEAIGKASNQRSGILSDDRLFSLECSQKY
jgi:hypothetical protein